MSQNVLTPLLADSRLMLPGLESSKIAAPLRIPTPRVPVHIQQSVSPGKTPLQDLGKQVAANQSTAAVPAPTLSPSLTTSPADLTAAGAKGVAPMLANGAKAVGSAVGNAGMATLRGLGSAGKAVAKAPFQAAAGLTKLPGRIVEHMAGNPAMGAADAPGVAGAMSRATVGQGAGIGAALGAAKGALDPGTSTDDNGNQVQNSRLMAMAGGAATGGLLGGVAAPLSRLAAPHVAKIPALAGAKEASAKVGIMISLPTFPFSKTADRIIKHPGSPGPRGTSSDAAYNRATGGPACTNTDAVTSTSKMATADQPASDLGATYNKATGVAPLSGPADLSKGPDGAKAETADHKKREALAKQETSGTAMIHAAPTHTPSGMTAVDREKAVQQFPVLSLRK